MSGRAQRPDDASPRVIRARIGHGVAIHGGVGTIPRAAMTPETERDYREALGASLRAGRDALQRSGHALDAVVAAVRVMEDSPLFNAGRGSNFDERGVITMDASIMDGSTLDAGAVAGVTDVRSPVELACLVMERSNHVMLIGDGAEAFARAHGIPRTEPSFFHTDRRWRALEQARRETTDRPDVLGDAPPSRPSDPSDYSGTVGAVALDTEGRLAAATSTGGMTNKTWGRVGDSPIIGAGTYASGRCAVSSTGWGEYFIRHAAAHDVHARMAHAGSTLAEAVERVIFDVLHERVRGSGGMVALDAEGHVALAFSTPGMYRGWVGPTGAPSVAIYRGEGV